MKTGKDRMLHSAIAMVKNSNVILCEFYSILREWQNTTQWRTSNNKEKHLQISVLKISMSLGRIPTHKSTVHQIKWKLTGIESPSPCNFKHVSSISHHVLCESPHPHPDIRLLKSYPSFQIQLKGHLFHRAFFFTLCQNLSSVIWCFNI